MVLEKFAWKPVYRIIDFTVICTAFPTWRDNHWLVKKSLEVLLHHHSRQTPDRCLAGTVVYRSRLKCGSVTCFHLSFYTQSSSLLCNSFYTQCYFIILGDVQTCRSTIEMGFGQRWASDNSTKQSQAWMLRINLSQL